MSYIIINEYICVLNLERANLVILIKGCFLSQVTSDNVICAAPVSPLDSDCVKNGTWAFKNIELSFGTDGVITLYVFSAVVFLFNLILFAATLYKFFRCHALSKQQVVLVYPLYKQGACQ